MPEHKTFRIPVQVNAEEKARIVAVAAERGFSSVSGFLRVLAIEAATAWEAGK